MNAKKKFAFKDYFKRKADPQPWETHDRNSFIVKVFTILICQLLFTAVCVYLPFLNETIKEKFLENWKLSWVIGIMGIVISCVMCCNKQITRRVPHNYILLALFTIGEAYATAQIAASFTPEVVISALFITGAMLISVALYALLTEKDFTIGRGVSFSYCVSFCTYLIVGYKWGYNLSIFFCMIGSMLAALYLISDIQSIVGGKREDIHPDDYVMGALVLYLDTLTLFVAML
jgi:FtsH-binding integral membrane protein